MKSVNLIFNLIRPLLLYGIEHNLHAEVGEMSEGQTILKASSGNKLCMVTGRSFLLILVSMISQRL